MRTLRGRAVIVLAILLGVVACSTPDKRPPESAGQPIDYADAGRDLIEHLQRV